MTNTLQMGLWNIGGAAITCKNELENIDEENLEIVSTQLRQALLSSDKVVGMDWSKRPGISDIACNVAGFRDKLSVDSTNFIVVHGGGLFNELIYWIWICQNGI